MPRLDLLAFTSLGSLAFRISQTERLLDHYKHRLDENDLAINRWLMDRCEDYREQLRSRLRSLASGSPQSDQDYTDTFHEVVNLLRSFGRDVSTLRHVAVPDVLRESRIASSRFTTAMAPAGGQMETPTLCLTSESDPSEHGVGTASVITLAKTDYASPTSWPVLLHEIAHGWYQNLDVVTGKYAQWLIELGCDRIAVSVGGPAALLALSLRAIVKPAYRKATRRHPPPEWRVAYMLEHSPKWARYTLAWRFVKLLHESRIAAEPPAQVLEGHPVLCFHCGSVVGTLSEKDEVALGNSFAASCAKIDAELSYKTFGKSQYAMAASLAQRLLTGVLIGASHDVSEASKRLAAVTVARETNDEVAQH